MSIITYDNPEENLAGSRISDDDFFAFFFLLFVPDFREEQIFVGILCS